MDVLYPPVGIAHIVSELPDLLADRMDTASSIRIACVMQPKSEPHFGSGIVILSAFALAELLRAHFGKDATVLVDILDNAPGETVVLGGVQYTRCLSHQAEGDRSTADAYTAPIIRLATWASERSQVPVATRRYAQIQAQPGFRHGLLAMLSRPADFIPAFSPSEGVLRIRPVCPACGLVDKAARTVRFSADDQALSFTCGEHGRQSMHLGNLDTVIDANAPVRTVLRSLCLGHDRDEHGIETIVLNGGDWAGEWMQRVYFNGLEALGCTSRQAPFNMFTPQVLDWSGAKLSKTIYLRGGAYAGISPAWTSMAAFHERFGDDGLDRLWEEIVAWTRSPGRFFRNYTVDYFEQLFTGRQDK